MSDSMMTRLRSLLLNALIMLIPVPGLQAADLTKPNVVLIVADDYGWKDAGCYGSDFYQTPNIDRLAQEGIRFTQAYSACTVCSPSRAALLTGEYPARLHVTDWIPGQMPENPKLLVPDWTKYLPLEEVTLARVLREAGYATASIGKWHLGGEEYYPEKHGFDVNIGGTSAPAVRSYFAPYGNNTLPDAPAGEYVSDRLGEEAVQFIEQNKDRPFFLYLPHFAVHTPIQAKKDLIEKHRSRLRPVLIQTNETYAAMIESMDEAIGRVCAKLDQLGLSGRTIIIFTSDNGGRVPTTSNSPLRVGKGSCYEGGTRVPFIIRWPGVTRAGTTCDTPVIGPDVFPTVLEMTGVGTRPTSDSISLVPLLKGTGSLEHDALFWHYPHYQHYQLGGTTPYGAIRAGDFKLIEFFDDMRVELYNLRQDIGEQNDLATQMPERADELRKRLHDWRKEVGAQMPSPNPKYDPSRPEYDPQVKKAKPISLLPEQIPPVVLDKQDFQAPDRVQLTGWAGTRIEANESNRLVKLDPMRLLEGFRKRPGRQKWDGEHVGKWMHAATLAWANTGDPALRRKLDYVAAELIKCQLEDGYLGTYVDTERWTEWDVWAHKYNLIGLITYMRYTGNLEPLPACRRMADLLCKTFGDEPGKRDLILAGQHMGMAPTSVLEPMVLLYRMTGEPRYLDFCKYILRAWEQPNGPKIISTLLDAKRVDKVGNAKAYEMLSCLNGALEYHRTVGDPRIVEACVNAWQDIVDKRLYPTGAASYREFFHADYDFPSINNVGETCVTVTWLQFNAHLLRLTGDARFAEQLERVVLNQLFGAQCPDGSAWGYYVQMAGQKPYSSTLDGHCCLSSGPRGVALIPTFAVATDAEGVVVNLYDAGRARLNLRDGTTVTLITETLYPAEDQVRMTLQGFAKTEFVLKLRIPVWCKDFSAEVNGERTQLERGGDGYATVRRTWRKGDTVVLRLKLEPRVLIGDHKNHNKLAVMYGPLVLAADDALITASAGSIGRVEAPGAQLHELGVTPEPATGAFKTWPGARLFRTNLVFKKPGTSVMGTTGTTYLVPFADAGATSSSYKIWLPFAGRRAFWNLLYDGIESRSRKPSSGSVIDDDPESIASTQTGKRAQEDWFAVELTEPVTISNIVFVHGRTSASGGWFDASEGKPRVEIKTTGAGQWEPLARLENYPATTSADPAGLKAGESITCELPSPVAVYGVRVIGKPASGSNPKQNFVTCGELQAYGLGL